MYSIIQGTDLLDYQIFSSRKLFPSPPHQQRLNQPYHASAYLFLVQLRLAAKAEFAHSTWKSTKVRMDVSSPLLLPLETLWLRTAILNNSLNQDPGWKGKIPSYIYFENVIVLSVVGG